MRSFLKFVFSLMFMLVSGCCDLACQVQRRQEEDGVGGGEDSVAVHLPFPVGYISRCVQGAGGTYSHHFNSTQEDVDLDTPNGWDDPIFAPENGMLFVHDDDPDHGFGIHANLDLNDGSYLVMAHLKEVFVEDGSEVAKGQLLGLEGTTGASTGDHVHYGRHQGSAERDAGEGRSIEGLEIMAFDKTTGTEGVWTTQEMVCGIPGGHEYMSLLPVTHWHPDGTLLKLPDEPTVYLVEDGGIRPFTTEDSFTSRNYDFGEVVMVTQEEKGCYEVDDPISGAASFLAVRGEGADAGVWLVYGTSSATDRYRMRMPAQGWQGVLKSWGILASTLDDVPLAAQSGVNLSVYPSWGTATFRDGTLISPETESAVYAMANGVAMPVDDWSTYLLLGFNERRVLEVPDDEFYAAVSQRGSCLTDVYCITASDVTACGGDENDEIGQIPPDTGEMDTDYLPFDTAEDTDEYPNTDSLTIIWTAPGGSVMDRIALSGELIPASGGASGWGQDLALETQAVDVTYVVPQAMPGDRFRFSVEYRDGDVTAWSCVAPFPPGDLRGVPSAMWRGHVLPVEAAAAPGSDGCELQTIVE